MNAALSEFLLLSVPGLPLLLVLLLALFLPKLLAFPALSSRLFRAGTIALLPALILLTVPAVFSIQVPWLLFGTGLGIDGASRLLLAMSVVLWAVAATFLDASDQAENQRLISFFLLTMAGHLGAILATDLAGFFTFSSLMSLGFYGLLVDAGDEPARRAGRIYLGFMIVADLVLFDVLLITAATTGELGFQAVHHAISQSPSLDLYLLLVLFGFAAKAGVWPLYFWLLLAFRSTRPAVAVLLGGVPVAIALLGAVRWLPLGEIASPELGVIIQSLGVATMLYAILAGLIRAQLKMLPAYVAIIATGLFATALGAGLADPAAWNRYGVWAYVFIASMGFGLAVLVIAIRWLETRDLYSAPAVMQAGDSSMWSERLPGVLVRWSGLGVDILRRLRALWRLRAGRVKVDSLWQLRAWQRTLDASERSLQRWTLAITLLLLLGLVVTFVVAFAGASSWR